MKKKDLQRTTYYCTIELTIFRTAILVLVSDNMEDIIKDLSSIYKDINPAIDPSKDIKQLEKIYEEDEFMYPGRTIKLPNDAGDVIMIFKEKNISQIPEETIVHETHHASHFVLEYRGICDEECEAYVQEYLFNQMMCKIDEWNDQKKKKK